MRLVTLVGTNAPVVIPACTRQYDYELEEEEIGVLENEVKRDGA